VAAGDAGIAGPLVQKLRRVKYGAIFAQQRLHRAKTENAVHIVGLLFIVLAVLAAVWFYHEQKQVAADNSQPRIERTTPHPDALELLKERYARGEINRQEYLEKKRDLEK